jgi:hypothetical protein
VGVAAEVLRRGPPAGLVTGLPVGGGGSELRFQRRVLVKGTVAAGAAEQVFVSAPAKPRARKVSRRRAWRREERAAGLVLAEARRSGDAQLIERARRGWSELRGRTRP